MGPDLSANGKSNGMTEESDRDIPGILFYVPTHVTFIGIPTHIKCMVHRAERLANTSIYPPKQNHFTASSVR